MGNESRSVDEFIRDFSPLVRSIAWRLMSRFKGWFRDPTEELKDLYATGILELVSIFPKVNFENKGYPSYVKQRVWGCLSNSLSQSIPGFRSDPPVFVTETADCGGNRPRQFVQTIPIDEIIETKHEPGTNEDLELLLFRHEVLGLIDEFMEDLSPKERFMLTARFHDERTYEQIGMAVQMGREAVSERLRRIIERLARFLRQRYSLRLNRKDVEEYLQETDLSLAIVSEKWSPPSAGDQGERA